MERLFAALKRTMPKKLFGAFQPGYHFFLAFLAGICYGFPARRLKVIGVTGTKGKTTTVELVHAVLAESGAVVSSLSSLRFKLGERETPNTLKMTMPGRFFVQRFLRDAVRAGAAYAVLEVTSQGITQFRHRFIRFHGAVMTNVAPEHLEAHGGFENYLRAKLDLFWRLPRTSVAAINRDDPSWPRFSAATGAHKMFYSGKEITFNGSVWHIGNVVIGERGVSFTCRDAAITSPLLGAFNFHNILAAVSVGLAEHMPPERIAAGVSRVSGVAGRMEFVQREPFRVVVDYAHTPDSLRNVYTFLKESTQNPKPKTYKPKLICVLGATGGGRDRWKRPEFGRIAVEYCDQIFLTNEDPYDESPDAIMADIERGIPEAHNLQSVTHKKIIDRREAIRVAVGMARPGDTVVITGKGAEPWIMGLGGSKIPWDDRAIVREELERLNNKKMES